LHIIHKKKKNCNLNDNLPVASRSDYYTLIYILPLFNSIENRKNILLI